MRLATNRSITILTQASYDPLYLQSLSRRLTRNKTYLGLHCWVKLGDWHNAMGGGIKWANTGMS